MVVSFESFLRTSNLYPRTQTQLIINTETQPITFVSKTWGGYANDKHLTEYSGLLAGCYPKMQCYISGNDAGQIVFTNIIVKVRCLQWKWRKPELLQTFKFTSSK